MARYPRLMSFEPELHHRLSDGSLLVRVGVSTKVWVTAVMRKQVLCGLCNDVINKKEHSWREKGQTTLYCAKRVCTRCWPKEIVNATDSRITTEGSGKPLGL